MCHRLYRPGYSMPELSTPPRRSSTCRVMSASRAGSNGAAVQVTRTPAPVSNCVSSISALALVIGPGAGRYGRQRRPPAAGRSPSGVREPGTASGAAPPASAQVRAHAGSLLPPGAGGLADDPSARELLKAAGVVG